MTREDKLKKIKDQKAGSSMVILSNGEDFINALQSKIDTLRDTLGNSVDVDATELIDELKHIDRLLPVVRELIQALQEIEFPKIPEIPKDIKLSNLNEAVTAIKELKLAINSFQIEIPKFPTMPKSITLSGADGLTKAIEVISKQTNTYDEYKPADSDTSSSQAVYHGFVDKRGKWFILRHVDINGESHYRFASGSGDYSTAWQRRTSHNYQLYSEVTL